MFKRELLKYTINEKYEDRIEQEVMKLVFEKLDEQLKEQSAVKRKLTELKDKIEKLEIRFIDHDISKELFEKYGITADYFKRRRTGKNHARETDHDFRERIEKIMDLDNAAAAVRETNATLAKKDKEKPNA